VCPHPPSLSIVILPIPSHSLSPSTGSRENMSARKELSPLEVPEVLILVFAHLGLHSIRVHASLVCRLWYKVAAPILRARPLVWYRPDRESETVLSKRLQETKSLIIKKPNYRGTYHDVSVIWEDTSSWIELTKHLFEASQLQITELTILQRLERDIQVLPILAKIGPQLTRLRLSNMSRSDDVPLDRILILCPRLKVLHLHYLHLAYYHDNYRNQLGPSQQPVLPSRLELQSLTLECIGVEERSLLRLLESCSGLKELRLIQLLRGWPPEPIPVPMGATNESLISFSKQPLFAQIASLCPSLRSFHFSGGSLPFWNGSRRDTVSQTLKLFPDVTQWSFQSFSAEAMLKALKTYPSNTLTSVEILHRTFIADRISVSLHQYLCESPHLLHLKAPDTMFPIMWFDLEGILDSQGQYHRRSPTSCYSYSYDMVRVIGRYIEPFHRKIWACRNLQTLHIRFDTAQGDNFCGARSRVLFGYLSRVCPRLQDLAIKHPSLRLDLDGGFSLLSRLQGLRRLSLAIGKQHRKYIRCIDWIARQMTPYQRFMVTMRIEMLFALSIRKSVYARTPFSSTDLLSSPLGEAHATRDDAQGNVRGLTRGGDGDMDQKDGPNSCQDFIINGVDMRNVGQWKDIKDLFEDRFSQNWSCWPHLESFEIRTLESDQTNLERAKARIRRLRPDAEVL